MGFLLDIYRDSTSIVLTFFRLISIGISGESDKDYYTTTLHLSLWKLELTTSLGWRK